MEIEQLRKEFNQVLANITEHSERFTGSNHLPALEVSVMMSKINKLQEIAAILKHKIQHKEENRRLSNKPESIIDLSLNPVVVEEIVSEEIIKIQKESKAESTTLNKASISDKFLHTPISSLKDAFSLNDRYVFANELFKKDMTLFNKTPATYFFWLTNVQKSSFYQFVKAYYTLIFSIPI